MKRSGNSLRKKIKVKERLFTYLAICLEREDNEVFVDKEDSCWENRKDARGW